MPTRSLLLVVCGFAYDYACKYSCAVIITLFAAVYIIFIDNLFLRVESGPKTVSFTNRFFVILVQGFLCHIFVFIAGDLLCFHALRVVFIQISGLMSFRKLGKLNNYLLFLKIIHIFVKFVVLFLPLLMYNKIKNKFIFLKK